MPDHVAVSWLGFLGPAWVIWGVGWQIITGTFKAIMDTEKENPVEQPQTVADTPVSDPVPEPPPTSEAAQERVEATIISYQTEKQGSMNVSLNGLDTPDEIERALSEDEPEDK